MALPRPIASTQTDAKSPIDDNLMDSLRINQEYLDTQITGGSALFDWNVNGKLGVATTLKGEALDTAIYFTEFSAGVCRAVLKKSGTGGKIKFDLRKVITPRTPITGIESLFIGSTQSVARVAGTIATQSIARTIASENTQSISYAKSTLNIQSITNLGNNLFKYNFTGSLLDSDYRIGDSILVASATDANNNGTFEIVEVNHSGIPSLVVVNASGVEQVGVAGTIELLLFSYNYTNPVNADIVVGENVLFSAHTSALNNGSKEVYKVNELGNNIWTYNSTGIEQVGVAGTADCERWVFAYSSSVIADHYVAGENALLASHTSGLNNGQKRIVEINRAGNNLIIYNPNGVVQGGAVGNASSNRWVYGFSTNPSTDVSVNDKMFFTGHTNALNDGIFTIVVVNIAASNNVVAYNQDGIAQAGVAGEGRHTYKKVKFSTDQSLVYAVGESLIEIENAVSVLYNRAQDKAQIPVLDVNYGGGSNFNVVIDGQDFPEQPTPSGFIAQEARSIFIAPPEQTISTVGNTSQRTIRLQSSNFKAGNILPSDTLYLYLMEVPEGNPQSLTVWLQ